MVCIIVNKFSNLLKESSLKITTISKATGISRTTLTDIYFQRSGGISFRVLDILCKYLGCTTGDLFEYVDDNQNKNREDV